MKEVDSLCELDTDNFFSIYKFVLFSYIQTITF